MEALLTEKTRSTHILNEIAHYAAHIISALATVSLWHKIDYSNAILITTFSLLPDAEVSLHLTVLADGRL